MLGLSTLITAFLALTFFLQPGSAAPSPQDGCDEGDASATATTFWMADIARQGTVAWGADGFQIFRNVKDFGAVGDGVADDTQAINNAITLGNRCGQGCDSSTVTPAIVYFPPGTYRVSTPIIPYYYTQLVGDAISRPILKADAAFVGIAVIDADPYDSNGNNWYTNQNNFFRQVRNFVIDVTEQPLSSGTGIHWQVAQATSLQNIEFNMRQDKSDANRQQGIFMDNGSGGFMTDLTFNGGRFGAFLGNQQFTTRNLKFNNCKTAIFMNWNWAWTFHGVEINGCDVGIDMSNGGSSQTVGSILLLDSKISNTPVGVSTVYVKGSQETNGTLILDNVDMSEGVPVAVFNPATQSTVLAGNVVIQSFLQGNVVQGTNKLGSVQDIQTPIQKPAALLDSDGRIAARSKPQYEDIPSSRFISVKQNGAVGNGEVDDSDAIQAIFDSAGPGDVVYFDHGAYAIHKTVKVPKDIKITGEIWPLIMAAGDSFFQDINDPKPVFQVGEAGDTGATVEMSDLMFETLGPQPGAILMEWNVEGESPGAAGLWDVHFRVGGSAGTQLQSDKCVKTPDIPTSPNPDCIGAFMLMHVTEGAAPYFENTWFWVSDHELDLSDHSQINIYNGRGVLIESTKGAWLWGTASEHNVLYNYQLTNAQNVFMGHIQTETAYFQGNPDATVPFPANAAFSDPDFSALCAGGAANCARTYGLIVENSKDVFVYGAGLYSFFDNYGQTCLETQNCQQNMVSIDSDSETHLFGLSTKAAFNMVTLDGQPAALDSENRNNFCAALAVFHSSAA